MHYIRDNGTSEPLPSVCKKGPSVCKKGEKDIKFPLKRDENLGSLVGLMELSLVHQAADFTFLRQ